ncbi:MAG TPA: DUF4097 domain-containing protein [Bacillaceae bacterium]|nr:DUF4097 domain-containing protein [Paenibacillus bovis]HLU23015.1 DUF4097 domain-containing protein [Bacillaceae bacterium]
MSQERKRILEMVQEGKLSAQEAIILLDALDGKSDVKASTQDSATTSTPVEETTQEEASTGKQEETNKNSEKKDSDSFYSQLESAGERIFDFVNNAFKKIKDIDLQFNQSLDVPHTFQQDGSEIERIDIDVANGPVRIVGWDQQDVRVECDAKVYRSDDRESARNYFLENTVFSVDNGLLIFGTQSKWMKVETVVYVPKKQYKKLSIRIFHGGISAEGMDADYVTLKTTNGKVDITRINGEKIDIETVNGQVNVKQSQANKLEIETVNGTIDLPTGVYQDIDVKTFNGNINTILPSSGTRKIEAKVVTGNIYLDIPRSVSINGEVSSNLGSYKLDLHDINVMHEKREVIQKQVSFRRTGLGEEVIYVIADTKTGTVQVRDIDVQGE